MGSVSVCPSLYCLLLLQSQDVIISDISWVLTVCDAVDPDNFNQTMFPLFSSITI